MSFRTRLTSFFVVIVVLPMIAVGVLVFRLISDSEQGKADARASGLATAAANLYSEQSASARNDARTIASNASVLTGPQLRARLTAIAAQAGLARITLSSSRRVVADVGDRTAIAPGAATLRGRGGRALLQVTVSLISASEYARQLAGPGVALVIRQGRRVLYTTVPRPATLVAAQGDVTIAGRQYRANTQSFAGFGRDPVQVTVLSDLANTASSVRGSRVVAAIFIAAFLLLAFFFSVTASRQLQGQLSRFLEAARRLAGGDFSSAVPTEGRDEFAALGTEFNNMSEQLAHRLDELSQERTRLRALIRRIGQTFASNLNRAALLELALRTAVDAVQADAGRLTSRISSDDPLSETVRIGSLAGMEQQIHAAERAALARSTLGEAQSNEVSVVSVALGALEDGGRTHGLITVVRSARPFTDADRELLLSLSSQATLALENVELHFQVRRQAVTDELTGLANHGRFQDLLSAEIEQVRRYHHQVGLIMLDIDNFKSINDTYGHQQGDLVLKQVARVLRDTSRDADTAARYGGEEMALILPHTDLEGSYAIAERVRTAIEGLRIPRVDADGILRITASFGVAASSDGDKDTLIAEADGALYAAKHAGKNRTMRATPQTANAITAE
jgi:diguanylate cyclase (GGDEF)-like protein